MKQLILVTVVVLFGASSAFGQAGGINVYADPIGMSCDIYDTTAGLLPVYAVHVLAPGVAACAFAAPKPPCWLTPTWLSDTPAFAVTIGDSQTGVAIGYGQCLASPILVLTINYFTVGSPPGLCCLYPVFPNPNLPSGEIEVVDCNDNLLFGLGGSAVVNPDATCMCQPPLANEESTWGRVKSLYAE